MKHIITLFLVVLISSIAFAQEIEALKKPNIPLTEISFEEPFFNFGEIIAGEIIQNVFEFTNTGDAPLIITNAKGSCGCTVPEWPKTPIMPGESSYLLVQFDSKNKRGTETKKVTLTSNTDPALTFLTIKGQIVNDETEGTHEVHEEKPFNMAGELSAKNIELYPNPTNDIVNLKFVEHEGQAAQIDIYNNLGQVLATKQINSITDQSIEIPVSNYVPGTYVASIKIDGMQRIAKQFIVLE